MTGDPQRGLSRGPHPRRATAPSTTSSSSPTGASAAIGLDICRPTTAASCSTSWPSEPTSSSPASCPRCAQRLQIDVEHIRAVNPTSSTPGAPGQGTEGPDAEQGRLRRRVLLGPRRRRRRADARELRVPDRRPRPAFGDLAGGMTIAGGIAAGLFQRERTGEAAGRRRVAARLAMWMLSPDIVASGLYGGDPIPKFDRKAAVPTRSWHVQDEGRPVPHADAAAGRPVLARAVRATSAGPSSPTTPASPTAAPASRTGRVRRALDEIFASARSTSGRRRFRGCEGVWAPVQTADELLRRPPGGGQRLPRRRRREDGVDSVVANPVQFDEQADALRRRARARPAHRGDPPRARPRLGRDHRAQGVRRDPLIRHFSGSPAGAPTHR